jgi:hypothetical protein
MEINDLAQSHHTQHWQESVRNHVATIWGNGERNGHYGEYTSQRSYDLIFKPANQGHCDLHFCSRNVGDIQTPTSGWLSGNQAVSFVFPFLVLFIRISVGTCAYGIQHYMAPDGVSLFLK